MRPQEGCRHSLPNAAIGDRSREKAVDEPGPTWWMDLRMKSGVRRTRPPAGLRSGSPPVLALTTSTRELLSGALRAGALGICDQRFVAAAGSDPGRGAPQSPWATVTRPPSGYVKGLNTVSPRRRSSVRSVAGVDARACGRAFCRLSGQADPASNTEIGRRALHLPS